jgi:hypothetical protein
LAAAGQRQRNPLPSQVSAHAAGLAERLRPDLRELLVGLGAEVPHAAVVEALGDRPARMPPLRLDPLAVERGPQLVGRAAVAFVSVAEAHDRHIQPWLLLFAIRSARPTQGRRRCHALAPNACILPRFGGYHLYPFAPPSDAGALG